MSPYYVKRNALIDYLKMKTDVGDWHAVSDAANDLRVLEAERNATPQTGDTVKVNAPFRPFMTDEWLRVLNTESPLTACDPKPLDVKPLYKMHKTCVHKWDWSTSDCVHCGKHDPFKEAGWTSNPIKLDKIPQREFRCAYTAGDRCIRPHDHDGDHYFS